MQCIASHPGAVARETQWDARRSAVVVAALADAVVDDGQRERVVRMSRRAWEVIGPLAPRLKAQVWQHVV